MEEPPRTWRFPKEEKIKPHALPAAAVPAGASAFPVAAQSAVPFMQAEPRYSHRDIGDSLLVEGNLGASLCINTSGDIPEIHTVTGDADYSRPTIAMVPEPGERAMLMAGLALVAGAVRHRRHKRRSADALPAKEHMT